MMKKDNFLYLAILIPAIMIVITAISTRYFQVGFNPEYNFLYGLSNNYSDTTCEKQIVETLFPDQKIKSTAYEVTTNCKPVDLYVYDSKNQTSTSISLTEAKKFTLTKQASPDGYAIITYCNPGAMGWWEIGNNYGVCIRKENAEKRLEFKTIDPKKYNRFIFLGWIVPAPTDKDKPHA